MISTEMHHSESNHKTPPVDTGKGDINRLFPVFFKLEQLRVLLIGGGNVALEKLQAIMNNAPATKVTVVARELFDNFAAYAQQFSTIEICNRDYQPEDLDQCDLVIAAVNDIPTSEIIRNDAKLRGKLINVADKPSLCDFYLGSIVTKGNLKIAISTNGKSPTVAKRLREMFSTLLPDEMEDVLQNMQQIRDQLKGDFAAKIEKLNEITNVLVGKNDK